MKCNYDDWDTKVIKSINPKMFKVLQLMNDGQERLRAQMLADVGIDPNPHPVGSTSACGGNERTDYYLYKKGLIELVRMKGTQKVFKITEEGRQAWNAYCDTIGR